MARLQNALTKQLTDEHERVDLKLREAEESVRKIRQSREETGVQLYGVQHLGKVRTLSTTAVVFVSASGPLVMGGLTDLGVSYSTQCVYGGVFIFIACGIAWVALRNTDSRPLAKAS